MTRTLVGVVDWQVGKDWVMATDRQPLGASHKRVRQQLKPDDQISLGFAITNGGEIERTFTDPTRADSRYAVQANGLCEPQLTIDLRNAEELRHEYWTYVVTP